MKSPDSVIKKPDSHDTGSESSMSQPETSTTENSTKKKDRKFAKRVSFHSVDIHTHNLTLGDHPATQGGPPLSLDWDNLSSDSFHIDDYEHPTRVRRLQTELRMPPKVREEKLNDGFSRKEIFRAEQECRKIQNQRQHSLAMEEMEGVEVAWQAVVKKLKKWKNRKVPLTPAEEWLRKEKKARMQDKDKLRAHSMHGDFLVLNKNTHRNSIIKRSNSYVADDSVDKKKRLESLMNSEDN